MRIINLIALFACLTATVVVRADAQEPFTVEVRSNGGILGQSIPVDVVITNRTDDLLVVTSLEFRYHDKIVVPGGIERFAGLKVPGGQTMTYVAPMLWNWSPHQDEQQSEYYQDPVMFRKPGDQPMQVVLMIKRGRWVTRPGDEHIETEAIHDPIVVPFKVHVATPNDSASRKWWQLVSADANYAIFLAFGASPHTPEMIPQLEGFVRRYPTRPLARNVAEKLERMYKTREKARLAERPTK